MEIQQNNLHLKRKCNIVITFFYFLRTYLNLYTDSYMAFWSLWPLHAWQRNPYLRQECPHSKPFWYTDDKDVWLVGGPMWTPNMTVSVGYIIYEALSFLYQQ
jgi:hypothetical protein